jgi:hypothetical protein
VRRMLRILVFVVATACGMMTALPAAAATPPVEQGSFTFPVDEVDSGLCGFPIRVQSQATVMYTIVFDTAGNPVRLINHFSIAGGTWSANGVTLAQGSNHSTTTLLFDSSGQLSTVTIVGLTVQVFLPGGVAIEAGRFVEDVATGTETFVGNTLTPEDVAALCAALSG